MNNIVSFPMRQNKDPEESKYISIIDDIADDSIQEFLLTVVKNIHDIDINLLTSDDYHTQKVLAFLRETMISTIKKLQNEEHGIQKIAYDVIYFSEDEQNKELVIDLEDI